MVRLYPFFNKLEINPKPWYTDKFKRHSWPTRLISNSTLIHCCSLDTRSYMSSTLLYLIYEKVLSKALYYLCQQLLSLVKASRKWNVLKISSNKTSQIYLNECFSVSCVYYKFWSFLIMTLIKYEPSSCAFEAIIAEVSD